MFLSFSFLQCYCLYPGVFCSGFALVSHNKGRLASELIGSWMTVVAVCCSKINVFQKSRGGKGAELCSMHAMCWATECYVCVGKIKKLSLLTRLRDHLHLRPCCWIMLLSLNCLDTTSCGRRNHRGASWAFGCAYPILFHLFFSFFFNCHLELCLSDLLHWFYTCRNYSFYSSASRLQGSPGWNLSIIHVVYKTCHL